MSETQLNTVVCNTKRVPHYFKFIWSQCLHCLHHSKTGDCSCREDKYNRFISLPGGKGILATICGFKQLGYPQCAGDIGETHIPITAPKEYPKDYLNSKGQYYPVLQSVADHNHNLCSQWPLRRRNARLQKLRNFPFWRGGTGSSTCTTSAKTMRPARQ